MTKSCATANAGCCKKSLKKVVCATALGFVVAAVANEVRKPADQRTWHGFVAGVVPYDFRTPTPERVLAKIWDPEGPAVTPHVFGVGWTLNLGRLVAEAKGLAEHNAR